MKNTDMKKSRRKRLFFDIETSPNIVFSWRVGYKIRINHENIIKERAIINICYKWAGQKTVHSLTWDKNQNDKQMLKKFLKVFNEADEVISHNGNRFDIRWVRTRCIKHGIKMMPNPVSIDTLQSARLGFNFNSNSLNYIAKFLGLGEKLHHEGFNMWKNIVLKNDKQALVAMVRYCKQDVVLLERVWDKMNSYVKAKSSIADTTRMCPECNGNMKISKHRITAAGHKQVQLQCEDCGKYHTPARSRYENEKII